jgi:ATP dependent DNA ligase-like protein
MVGVKTGHRERRRDLNVFTLLTPSCPCNSELTLPQFECWPKPDVDDYGIGLIVGPSGSGKSILLREFGAEKKIKWSKEKAIISHFKSSNEAIERLMAVGLNTVPSWCKPYHVLSTGEQFRADLARRIKDGACIDEFTSVVDRNVAKATCVALKRFVFRNSIRRLTLATCHRDILEWLQPDWYFDTADGQLYSGRWLHIFDILVSDDRELLVNLCLRDRRARLEAFADSFLSSSTRIQLTPATTDRQVAQDWFNLVGESLEGVIAKRLDRPYDSGGRGSVVKVKKRQTLDAVVPS